MAGGSARTVTVLFTDLVGSTEVRTRIGDDAADALIAEHDALVGEAIAASGGSRVKSLGDGVMAVFESASAALDCAVSIQEALTRHDRSAPEKLPARVGLSAGDVAVSADDVHGTPVVEASRLCAAADAGQILCAEIVKVLAGSRGNRALTPVGELALKGLPDPVHAFEVGWTAADDDSFAPVVPAALAGAALFGFAGRRAERDALRDAWKEAADGRRRVVLVVGEPGIGKTRLASELAAEAAAAGGLVLAGRCDDELSVPYQPFVEALRHFVRHPPRRELRPLLGADAGELARLVPELPAVVPGLPAAVDADPDTERYRLFEAVAEWLAVAAAEAPVLLVLDDVHWATKPTLLMLRHIVRRGEPIPLLVVCTYRDTDLDRAHPLSEVLADLRREAGVERLPLRGLVAEEVLELLEVAAGHELGEAGLELARAVHAETEGNPFFVGAILQHLAETGVIYQRDGRWTSDLTVQDAGIPEGVREVIGRRLSRLSDDANTVLQAAAVLGRDFDLAVLLRMVDLDEPAVLGALEAATAAGIVAEVPDRVDRYRFTHALVEDTLYDELGTSRRVRLHRAAGEATEALVGGATDVRLPELAHHFGEAAAAGVAAKAIEYARAAAFAALELTAYEEAVRWCERALQSAEVLEPPDPSPRADLLSDLSRAHMAAGNAPEARAAAAAAVETARSSAAAETFARAAVTLSQAVQLGTANFFVEASQESADVLREAAARLGDSDSPLLVEVLGQLPVPLTFLAPTEERLEIADRGLAIAERLGDPRLVLHGLLGRHWALWDPAHLEERLAVADRLESVLDAAGADLDDAGVRQQLPWWRFGGLAELGDMAGVREAVDQIGRLAEELRSRFLRWQHTMLVAALETLAGSFAEAERLAFEAYAIGEPIGAPWLRTILGVQLMTLRRYQGRLAEIEPVFVAAAEESELVAIRCAVANIWSDDPARHGDARALLDELAAAGFADIALDSSFLTCMHNLTETCALLGDADRAALVYDRLLPYAHRQVVIPPGASLAGSASRHLGMLATTMERFDDAEAHFEQGTAFNERIGARPWLAHTRYEYARMLERRGREGDRDRARELLAEALAAAAELGLGHVDRRGRELRERLG